MVWFDTYVPRLKLQMSNHHLKTTFFFFSYLYQKNSLNKNSSLAKIDPMDSYYLKTASIAVTTVLQFRHMKLSKPYFIAIQ